MSIKKNVKSSVRKIRGLSSAFRRSVFEIMPGIFGHEITNDLIQFYRNDEKFVTALSFNHFVEFFSGFSDVMINVRVRAFDRYGHALGTAQLTIGSQGVKQVYLRDLFAKLDTHGFYSVSMTLTPKYKEAIAYLGALSPQFMTIFVPQDQLSTVQMLHSHKRRQGFLPLPYSATRASAHIENLTLTKEIEMFALNSSKSTLALKIRLSDSKNGQLLEEKSLSIPGHGCQSVKIDSEWLRSHPCDRMNIEYQLDRPVSHSKPIIFRKNLSGAWSCNHT